MVYHSADSFSHSSSMAHFGMSTFMSILSDVVVSGRGAFFVIRKTGKTGKKCVSKLKTTPSIDLYAAVYAY